MRELCSATTGTGGAPVNERAEIDGKVALHFAAMLNQRDLLDVLLAAGADTSIPDNRGWTPLH